MARIRHIEVANFRGIQRLTWVPNGGFNCLIGPGDSGKSTVLDAIDWCVGARRTLSPTDADFHHLKTQEPIQIDVTLGDLDGALRNLETYGVFLRGFNASTGEIEDEPAASLETVLTVQLKMGDDLEPHWQLLSDRAVSQGVTRNLSWADRVRIAPVRIGSYAAHHLGWQKGSILTRIYDEKADAKAALALAAREARESFGDNAGKKLEKTLSVVAETADELGIPYGGEVRALLDAHTVSFSGGTISLHDDDGVPLARLGLGSSRLLVAGLQRRAGAEASIALVDELEHGLEPHRIGRFLQALGSKDDTEPLQVFVTTHSPVVLRELASDQLFVLRRSKGQHTVLPAGKADEVQAALRKSAEAFLGTSVLVCEGATEVGLIRGIDLFRTANGKRSIAALGGVTVDAEGVSKIYRTARGFQALGYRVATLRDDDKAPDEEDEAEFVREGGSVFKWTEGWAIEDEVFDCVSDDAVRELYDAAVEVHGTSLIRSHLESAFEAAIDPEAWLSDLDDEKRDTLAKAAKKGGWFKSISDMESVARTIIGPDLEYSKRDLTDTIEALFDWVGTEGE